MEGKWKTNPKMGAAPPGQGGGSDQIPGREKIKDDLRSPHFLRENIVGTAHRI